MDTLVGLKIWIHQPPKKKHNKAILSLEVSGFFNAFMWSVVDLLTFDLNVSNKFWSSTVRAEKKT